MNIGIIGSGFTGSMHADLYAKITGAVLKGITSKTNVSALEAAQKHAVFCYPNYKEILDDDSLDVIDICTPTVTHASIAAESMRRGKHVILEFPAVSNLHELHELQNISLQTGKTCALAYYSRFQSQYSYIFNAASSLSLGKINGLSISRKSSNVFATDDIVNNLMSQDVDFMVRLLGRPEKIFASHTKQEHAVFIFEYNEVSAILEGAVNMHDGFPFTTRHCVSGTEGSISLFWRFTDRPEYLMTQTSKEESRKIVTEDYDPYQKELEIILAGLASENTSTFDLNSAAAGIEVTFECRSLLK
jgi:predicted dehydrogenase